MKAGDGTPRTGKKGTTVTARRFLRPRRPQRQPASQRGFWSERGQAVVELAFVFPVIALLIFGALDIGRLFNAQIVVTQAAREGARLAATDCTLNPTTCLSDVDTRVQSSLSGLDVTKSSVTLSPGPYVSGDTVTVQVNYTIGFITPLIGSLIPGSPFTLSGATTMRLE